MTRRTNYQERREIESVMRHDLLVWGDEDGLIDAILRCIEDADRLEEVENG